VLQCPAGTFTQKAYGSNTTASCVNYTTIDWVADSTAYAQKNGKPMIFDASFCAKYIQAKTGNTNTTAILRNLKNGLCNYGPYNVQFCNWCVQSAWVTLLLLNLQLHLPMLALLE
jgi:hypothetical protein